MQRLLVVLGPTASGKTTLATHLALSLQGSVISADSRQVYRGMDIGTGKDLAEYQINGQSIPYELIDIRGAGERYHINDYYTDFVEAYRRVLALGNTPILCGGSGLYIEIALQGNPLAAVPINEDLRESLVYSSKEELQHRLAKYPKKLWQQADISSHKRLIRAIEIADFLSQNPLPLREHPTFEPVLFGMQIDREARREKITRRLKYRLENGLIEEVAQLLRQGVSAETLAYYGLEYKWVLAYLHQQIDYPTLFDRLNVAIHQFAKRQMTWFRKMEKDGYTIHWIDALQSIETQMAQVLAVFN